MAFIDEVSLGRAPLATFESSDDLDKNKDGNTIYGMLTFNDRAYQVLIISANDSIYGVGEAQW